MYGLLGKTLKHSFSKEIHEHFTDLEYTLFETDNLKEFFETVPFSGINVTIPYKNDVIPYLNELSQEADDLQSVNTIINRSGKLIGYNTDYYGLEKALEYEHISVKDKDIIIVGNGSTSRTIKYYCERNLAKNITILARNPKENEYHFTDVENFKSTTIIFNATPVGMFPGNNESFPIDLSKLPHLISAIDMIYNPLRSSFLIAAKKRGIKVVNGLFMLISQAVKSIELFHNTSISNDLVKKYYKDLYFRMSNIVFIGMPMSGKSYFTKVIGTLYQKEIIDIDRYIEKRAKMTIPEIFKLSGETGFRKLEYEIVYEFSIQHNKAISCGGGVVLNPQNIEHLKQNGVILFLDMPLSLLKKCNPRSRPLLKDKKNLEKLYEDRYDLYKTSADIIIPKNTFDKAKTQAIIEVKIDEYFNS